MAEFRRTRSQAPTGAHVLSSTATEDVVRVMYIANHIPPDRAWFAVPSAEGPVRELTFEEVSYVERPWR